MPDVITNYQCPSCTGPMHFDQATGKLVCDYCGSSYSIEEVEAMFAEKNQAAEAALEELTEAGPEGESTRMEGQWDLDSVGGSWEEDDGSVRAYSCPTCGAELLCDATTAATACPYCGNPTIIPGQLGGTKKPDLIIPFRLGKEDAVQALKKHYAKKPLLPKAFASANHIQEVKGVYVPFWLFDAKVHGDITCNATRVHTRTTAKEIITETDHYLVRRKGTLEFKGIPVDGATKMPDAHMDAIEPYDYRELKPFSLSYLPGFLADKYDVDQETSMARARQRCETSTVEAILGTIQGYSSCVPVSRQLSVEPGAVKYALLPVWMLSTQWNGKNYLFAMNGQTGKLIGDLPIDKKRLAGFCLGAFAAVAAIALLFML